MKNSEIKIVALGGQNERGKNCFFIETKESIYVFNAGVKIPLNGALGISKVSVDFEYLLKNEKKIKGVFIGTPNFSNIGGIGYLLQKLTIKVPVYTSMIGATIIESYLEKRIRTKSKSNIQINVCEPLKEILFKDTTFVPFRVSNHIPFSYGWVIKTDIGNIIFIDEFFLNNEKTKLFASQLNYINSITKGNNTILLVGVGNVSKYQGFTSPNYKTKDFYEKTITSVEGRVVVALNDYNVYSLFILASIAKSTGRPFIVYGSTFMDTFSSIIKNKLFNPKNLTCLPISEIKNSNNAIIVIMGSDEDLYKTLFSILDHQITSIQFNENDNFILGTYLIPGYESHGARLLDELNRQNINNFVLPKSVLPLSASNEDHKYLIDYLKPKHIIPMQGLYMNFIKYEKVVEPSLFADNHVYVLDNGDGLIFNDKGVERHNKYIKDLAETYINDAGFFDANVSILLERKQMSLSGVVLMILYYDKASNSFVSKIDFKTIGLSFDDGGALFKEAQEKLVSNVSKYIAKSKDKIDLKETKINFKKGLIRILEKKMNKKPLVLPSIIEF